MANKLKGEIEFRAGEEAYVLLYSIDALCELEDRLDISLSELADKLGKSARLKFLRTVLWVGLRERHPDLTEKAAGELLGLVGLTDAGLLITEALVAAFPEREVAAEGQAPLEPAVQA